MARILLISTGGTLASSDSGKGLSPDLSGSYLAERLKGLIDGVELDTSIQTESGSEAYLENL